MSLSAGTWCLTLFTVIGTRRSRWRAAINVRLSAKAVQADANPTLFISAATCGKICVVEVEEVVPVGSLDPDSIHLPGVYVQRMIIGAPYDKKIEFRTLREREAA